MNIDVGSINQTGLQTKRLEKCKPLLSENWSDWSVKDNLNKKTNLHFKNIQFERMFSNFVASE